MYINSFQAFCKFYQLFAMQVFCVRHITADSLICELFITAHLEDGAESVFVSSYGYHRV